ncbi:LLM class F420-dependent oxidoreductase [Mycobacteriaceae bacterium 1482268.1]|nr:LLM class F420-dependent oxidoreductase [Mycobacteriaceae bacterium 1482268.1]
MKVDTGLPTQLRAAATAATAREAEGYDGLWTAETDHDPFLPLAIAAEHTEHAELGTGIAVAFARNPMTLANIAYDLQAFSGRFILGLGTQIRPHITRRFGMPWSKPVDRMRELVSAIHAIWQAWNTDTQLDFRGDFYTHTLMTPMFNPGPNPNGDPRIYIAGVGPRMTELAGEVGDGFLCHGFMTQRYLTEVTLPALRRGRARAGQTLEDFEISLPGFIVTGDTQEEMALVGAAVRKQLAFYASTPAYRSVLELHGWGELQHELNRMSKQGRWDAMGELIDNQILATFAVVAEPPNLAVELRKRWGDLVSRIGFYGLDYYAPRAPASSHWPSVISDLKSDRRSQPR